MEGNGRNRNPSGCHFQTSTADTNNFFSWHKVVSERIPGGGKYIGGWCFSRLHACRERRYSLSSPICVKNGSSLVNEDHIEGKRELDREEAPRKQEHRRSGFAVCVVDKYVRCEMGWICREDIQIKMPYHSTSKEKLVFREANCNISTSFHILKRQIIVHFS